MRTAVVNKAFLYFQMAVKIKPDYADAYNNLGAVLFHAKMTEEAIDYYKESISKLFISASLREKKSVSR